MATACFTGLPDLTSVRIFLLTVFLLDPRFNVMSIPLMDSQTQATKHDQGKPKIHLAPVDALLGAVRALEVGAKKYGEGNWEGGLDHWRLWDSAMRHCLAYRAGDDIDESGYHTLDHAIAALLMLSASIKRGIGKPLDPI